MMSIRIPARGQRLLVGACLLSGVLVYGFLAVRAFVAEQWASDRESPADLLRAVALEPENADYRMWLGRLYHRQMNKATRAQALEQYTQSLRRNPFQAWCWQQLSYLCLDVHDGAAAERATRIAERLGPYSASMAMSTAIFWLDRDRLDEATPRLRRALELDAQLDTDVFELCWDLELDPEAILRDVIPPRPPLLMAYLPYLIQQAHLDEAQQAWHQWLQLPQPFQLPYAYRIAGSYMDFLIQHQETEEAVAAWQQFSARRTDIPRPDPSNNLLYNGSFEWELSNVGFDWRIQPAEHAQVRTDAAFRQEGGRSLAITFDGKENLKFEHVYQLVPVEPDTHYYFSAYARTENITSDQGPRFELRDYYHPDRWSRSTEGLTGTHDWLKHELEFTTGPDTHLLALYISRTPSWRFASRIDGTVWVDNLNLRRYDD